MITIILKRTIKWSVTGLFGAYLAYTNADKISSILNETKYSLTESEPGFVKKEQALGIKIVYERNSKGNLETYLKTYDEKLPIYQRQEGILVGNNEYLFKNFSDKEKAAICSRVEEPKVKTVDKLKKALYDLYTIVGDEK